VVSRTTAHLSFSAALSPARVTPGARMSIAFDITPKPGMHVYAPGTQYRAVTIVIEPDALLKVHEAVYPEPSRYLFEPLNEEVLVYAAPFRMLIDVTAGETSAQQAQLRPGSQRVIKAALEYQACDDTVCYLPVTVPVQWMVRIAR
jgi:DsbC/DsbD-like thiol-disulfide interchange protein